MQVSENDRSLTQGNSVSHPESLSGLWETPDENGGAVGIYLQLSTTVPGAPTTLVGTTQSWASLNVALYRRHGATLNISNEEANFFGDFPRGGGVHFEHDRLTLHFEEFDLDLLHTPADQWTGCFHRGAFDRNVTLKRPQFADNTTSSIVGTWRETDSPVHSCIHIVQTASGAFTGWSDMLNTWGSTGFTREIPRPAQAWEYYGELMRIEQSAPNTFSVELDAYNVICCPRPFVATFDSHSTMTAYWPAGPKQSPRKSTWVKMPGDTCITAD